MDSADSSKLGSKIFKPGMVDHTYNLRTWDTKARGLRDSGWPDRKTLSEEIKDKLHLY
jgi:hypothetical protein